MWGACVMQRVECYHFWCSRLRYVPQAQQAVPCEKRPKEVLAKGPLKQSAADKASSDRFEYQQSSDEMEKANEKRDLQEIRGTVSEKDELGKKTGRRISTLDNDSNVDPQTEDDRRSFDDTALDISPSRGKIRFQSKQMLIAKDDSTLP
jgi:hypothetical protein